jgi:DNA-binding NarL/FixJ family response regulator
MARKTATPPKRIFIIDDHPIFRDGLRRLVSREAGLEVCGEAEDAETGLDAVLSAAPDLVLLDIGLPGRSGLDLLHSLKLVRPEIPVLVISMHDETLYAERVLRLGGRGYLMKRERPEVMVAAIGKVLAGQVHFSDRITGSLLSGLSRRPGVAGAVSKLTERELEVLRLTGQGKDNHQVAKELRISLKTVDTHRAHLREKLGLKNGTELIHYAVRWVGDTV